MVARYNVRCMVLQEDYAGRDRNLGVGAAQGGLKGMKPLGLVGLIVFRFIIEDGSYGSIQHCTRTNTSTKI